MGQNILQEYIQKIFKTFSYKQFDQKQERCIFNVQSSGSVDSSKLNHDHHV